MWVQRYRHTRTGLRHTHTYTPTHTPGHKCHISRYAQTCADGAEKPPPAGALEEPESEAAVYEPTDTEEKTTGILMGGRVPCHGTVTCGSNPVRVFLGLRETGKGEHEARFSIS